MPAIPPESVAIGRALFGAPGTGLYPHRATIRRAATGKPEASRGGVVDETPVTVADDVPCRLGVPQLPVRDAASAGASADRPAYVLAFPLAASAGPLDVQRDDAVTVTGDGVNGEEPFTRVVYVVSVDVPKPTDVRRKVTCQDTPAGDA